MKLLFLNDFQFCFVSWWRWRRVQVVTLIKKTNDNLAFKIRYHFINAREHLLSLQKKVCGAKDGRAFVENIPFIFRCQLFIWRVLMLVLNQSHASPFQSMDKTCDIVYISYCWLWSNLLFINKLLFATIKCWNNSPLQWTKSCLE